MAKKSLFWQGGNTREPQKSQVIIGGNSQTGKALEAALLADENENLIISSSRAKTTASSGLGTSTDIGLDLSEKKSASDIATWVAGQVDMLVTPEITLHLHAMSMKGIDTSYPEKIVQEIRKYSNALIKVIYISYEQGYDEAHKAGSHVSYDARSTKDALEASVLGLDVDTSIVDLIVFDSPSAKVLGPTFVGVVGDFVGFLRRWFADDRQSKTMLESVFGQDQDIVGLEEFLALFPLRGPLGSNQKSMKELAGRGEFQTVINKWSKIINFGNLSLVSGIISELYLPLAMQYIIANEDALTRSKERTLVTWDVIGDYFSKEGILEALLLTFKKIKDKKNTPEPEKSKQVGVFIKGTDAVYTLNIKHLDLINEHFGIVPMVLQHQLVLESGVLNKGEYISSIKCPSQMYAGEELKIERSEDSITVSSARNPREVFTEIKVANRSSRYESISKPKHILDRTLVEDDATLRELVDQNKTPHREKWIRHFLKGIPVSIDKLQLPISSSIIEFLGFKIGALIKTKGEFLHTTFGIKKDDLEKLKGVFGKVDITHMSPDFEEVIACGDYLIEIERFIVKSGVVSVKLNILQNQIIKGAFSMLGA